MKERFTDEQIVGFLKGTKAGAPIRGLCCKHGFSDATFYGCLSRFSRMEVADAARISNLEAEKKRLKRLFSEAHLDIGP